MRCLTPWVLYVTADSLDYFKRFTRITSEVALKKEKIWIQFDKVERVDIVRK